MLTVGLTGGLATGKSFVAAEFARLGCCVVEADQLGHEAIAAESRDEIIAAFGTADRPALAKIVFADPARLAELNAIVHPAVRRRAEELIDEIAARDPQAIAIYVAAIVIETGSVRDFAKLIVLNCTREQQIVRSLERGLSQADITARLDRQLPTEKKIALADYVIDTGGSKEETIRQTKMVYGQLKDLTL